MTEEMLHRFLFIGLLVSGCGVQPNEPPEFILGDYDRSSAGCFDGITEIEAQSVDSKDLESIERSEIDSSFTTEMQVRSHRVSFIYRMKDDCVVNQTFDIRDTQVVSENGLKFSMNYRGEKTSETCSDEQADRIKSPVAAGEDYDLIFIINDDLLRITKMQLSGQGADAKASLNCTAFSRAESQ